MANADDNTNPVYESIREYWHSRIFHHLTRYPAHTLLRTSAPTLSRTPHRNDDDTKIQKNTAAAAAENPDANSR